jgi:POT family proton-dependent oligopeptide transporter
MRFVAIGFFCAAAIVFFSVLKQAGSTMSLFADRFTCNDVFGWTIPSAWYQSAGPAFVILLTPWLSRLWLTLDVRQPTGAAKVTLGLGAAVLALFVLMCAARAAVSGCVNPAWLLSVFLIVTLGELCLSPVGLSSISRLSPARMTGLMVAAWFASIGVGSKLAAQFAGRSGFDDSAALADSVGTQTLGLAVICVIAVLFVPRMSRLTRALEARSTSGGRS